VAIPPLVYSDDSRAAACAANVQMLNRKVQEWARRHGGWAPPDQETFRRMVQEDPDLRGRLPECPFGEVYVYDPAAGCVLPHRH